MSLDADDRSMARGGGSGRGHGAGFNSANCFLCFGGGVEEGDLLLSWGRAITPSVGGVGALGGGGATSANCMSVGFDIASLEQKADNLLMG